MAAFVAALVARNIEFSIGARVSDRLLHAAARIVRRARQVVLRLPAHWPWAVELAEAYGRVGLLGT